MKSSPASRTIRAWHTAARIAFCILPFLAARLSAQEYSGDWEYARNGDAVTVTGYHGSSFDLVIPAAINDSPVTGIGALNQSWRISYVTNVTIPTTVTHIDSSAFDWCDELKEFTVQAANLEYGSIGGVLVSADRQTLIRYPRGREGGYTVPVGIVRVGAGAFNFCARLTDLVIPNSVTVIEASAVRSCFNLTRIIVGTGVTSIGPAGLDHRALFCGLGRCGFEGGDMDVFFLGNAPADEFPFGRRDLDDWPDRSSPPRVYCFSEASGWGAQFGGLTTIPWAVPFTAETRVASAVVERSATLNGLVVAGRSPVRAWFEWGASDGYGYVAPLGELKAPAFHLVSLTLTNLTPFAWHHYRLGTTDGSVTNYGADLTFFTEEVADFGFEIRQGEVAITNYYGAGGTVRIPSRIRGLPVTSIWREAFIGTDALTEWIDLFIPESVVSLGGSPLYANMLTSITVSPANAVFGSREGVLFSKDGDTLLRYPLRRDGPYTIPDGVQRIGEGAFESCAVTEVTIPASVSKIDHGAFSGCWLLSGVNAPESLLTDACSRFAGLGSFGEIRHLRINQTLMITGLQDDHYDPVSGQVVPRSVQVPARFAGLPVTRIADGAFQYRAVTNITIPNTVIQIGDAAFAQCERLLAIEVSEGNAAFSSLDGVLFDKNRKSLLRFPLARGGSYTLPPGITTIAQGAFEASRVSSVVIPDSVTRIGASAFAGCDNLARLVIGRGVSHVGESALDHRVFRCGWFCAYAGKALEVFFLGNAPQGDRPFGQHGGQDETHYWLPPQVFYLSAAAGWGPTFGGVSTTPWRGIHMSKTSEGLTLVWPGGQLQSASTLGSGGISADWTDRPAATPPFTVNPTNAANFYRVRTP